MDLKLQLESSKTKNSVNKDIYQSLDFEANPMIIPISEINNTVNTYELFEDERNFSTKYRLNVTLNPIMSNTLTNKLTEVRNINDGSLLTSVTTPTRVSLIRTIDDIKYEYKLGSDIFDNNFMRLDIFKTGETLNSFTGKDLYNIISIEKAAKDNLNDDNGWQCIVNKTKINNVKMFPSKKPCEKIDLFPTREYLLFKPVYCENTLKDNWSFVLTYPYENYTDSILVKSLSGTTGIPIVSSVFVTDNDNHYLEITTAYKHKLVSNDVIKIKSDIENNDKTYLVYNTGSLNRLNKDYTITIDADKYRDLINFNGRTDCRLVRVINKIDSEYYIRKFRKLPNFIDDTDIITEDNIDSKLSGMSSTGSTFIYDAYQPGFSRNIYNDAIYQLQYLDDIDINLLKDNLGRPLTEIYLTIIKKNIIDDSVHDPSRCFTKVMSGIDEVTGTTGYSNIRTLNGYDEIETPLEDNITITGATINSIGNTNCFLGDIVEYNRSAVKEVILDNVQHRFNTVQREEPQLFTYSDIYGDQSNLLLNSNISDGEKYWNGNNATITASTATDYVGTGSATKYLIVRGSYGEYVGVYNDQPIAYENGKTYNISFWAKTPVLGVTLDWVGIADTPGMGVYSFPLTLSWQRYDMTFIGDGKPHSLLFYSKYRATAQDFYITKIKVEKNKIRTDWLLSPIEGIYNFIDKTLDLNASREGYFYNPHHKIQLKNYSKVISNGELPEIFSCGNFISGITTSNQIKKLSDCTDNEVKSLILSTTSISGLTNYDTIRVTRKSDKKFVNLMITMFPGSVSSICIPYNLSIFSSLTSLTIVDYIIRKYSDDSIPKYSQDNYDGNCSWRKILKEGVFDSESTRKTELIFTNGRLYLSEAFTFYLKRQDPFGHYGIRNETFPADSYGDNDVENIINNIIQSPNNIC